MRVKSSDVPPIDREAVYQLINQLYGVVVSVGGQLCILGGGENAAMAKNFLYLQ